MADSVGPWMDGWRGGLLAAAWKERKEKSLLSFVFCLFSLLSLFPS